MSQPRPRRAGTKIAVALTAVASLAFGVPAATAGTHGHHQGRPHFTLTILHGNDFESQLLGSPGDADGDGTVEPGEETAFGGIARFATLVDDLRSDVTHGRPPPGAAGKRAALLLSAGDNFLAGPEWAASLDHGVPYFDAIGLARMGFEASTIGNHEFDFGPDVTASFIESFGGTTPFVSANLGFGGEPALAALVDDGVISARTVVKKKGERIGIVGLTTPELPSISSPGDVTVDPDLVGVATSQIDALQSRGIDKIILLSHLQDIDNEVALVSKLDGVDAVVGGGGGELLANADDRLVPGDVVDRPYPIVAHDADGTAVPVVTTPGDYKYLGELTVSFDRGGDVVGWVEQQTGAVRVSGVGPDAVAPDPWQQTNVVEPVRAFVSDLANTLLAQSEVPLDGVREHVRSVETNLGDLLADALRFEGARQAAEFGVPEPQVAFQNGGGIRNNSVIPTGPLTALDTFSVAPFPNFVAVLPEVPRATLKRLLERNVSQAPDTFGGFAQVSGLSFTCDTSGQAQTVNETTCEITAPGQRVRHVELADGTVIVDNGQVVPGPPVSLATNDFSARGGDCWPLAGLDFTNVGKTYQQALQEYLEEGLGGTVTAGAYPEGGLGRITAQ